jgi:hypothetical protein
MASRWPIITIQLVLSSSVAIAETSPHARIAPSKTIAELQATLTALSDKNSAKARGNLLLSVSLVEQTDRQAGLCDRLAPPSVRVRPKNLGHTNRGHT